jgi:putative sterol carrier protein
LPRYRLLPFPSPLLLTRAQTNAVFELRIAHGGEEAVWTVDVKHACAVQPGPAPAPDVVLRMSDDTFVRLAAGALDGRTAFLTGRLRTSGSLRLAPKFGSVFTVR